MKGASLVLASLSYVILAYTVVSGAPTKEVYLESNLTVDQANKQRQTSSQIDLDQFFKDQAHLLNDLPTDNMVGQPSVSGIMNQLPFGSTMEQLNQLYQLLMVINQLNPSSLISSIQSEVSDMLGDFIRRKDSIKI